MWVKCLTWCLAQALRNNSSYYDCCITTGVPATCFCLKAQRTRGSKRRLKSWLLLTSCRSIYRSVAITKPPVLSCFSRVRLFVILWTVARQAPVHGILYGHRSGLPCPLPGDFPDPAIKPTSPVSPALQADSLLLNYPGKPSKSTAPG